MKNDLMIFEQNERAVVSSRTIAEHFEKRHGDILAKLEGKKRTSLDRKDETGLIEQVRGTGNPVWHYFIKSHYKDELSGEIYREYLCTRDGFSLLVMGFTGQKALEWKLQYIDAFNKMESYIVQRQSSEWLLTRKQGVLVRRNETDVLAHLIEYSESQGSRNMRSKAYTIYSKMVNELVGVEAGQRDKVPFKTLSTIMFLEDMILHTINEEMERGTHYKQIYQICKANGEQIMKFAYLPKLTA